MIQAQTRYGVNIAKTFLSPTQAKEWASSEGQRYGAHRIIQKTPSGFRTIWKATEEVGG